MSSFQPGIGEDIEITAMKQPTTRTILQEGNPLQNFLAYCVPDENVEPNGNVASIQTTPCLAM